MDNTPSWPVQNYPLGDPPVPIVKRVVGLRLKGFVLMESLFLPQFLLHSTIFHEIRSSVFTPISN